jgi:hypothetical protein
VAQATHGIAVNAFASTPNNVAVGGTDFSDTYSGTNATYWNSTNTSAFGSAISYIPEIPWNDSCAGSLLSTYEGYSPTYGSTSLCNDPTIGSLLQTTVGGGGGPSQCASGTPSTPSVVSGSCQGWPKPSWQSVLGNPNDGVRDTPDVSLFAADGLWSHFYVFCWSDTKNGGAACGADPSAWSGAGGTSFASPIMAGIQALINQKAGGPQGNPAPVYYQLAASEYGSAGSSACNSNNSNTVAARRNHGRHGCGLRRPELLPGGRFRRRALDLQHVLCPRLWDYRWMGLRHRDWNRQCCEPGQQLDLVFNATRLHPLAIAC